MRLRLLPGIIFVVSATIGTSDAAYVIRLKNGNDYVTNRYWHEGSQVFFDTYGGVFGIDKAFVNKIEETDQVIRLARISDRDPVDKSQKNAQAENQVTSGETEPQESRVTGKRDPDDPIIGEFNRLKQQSKEVDGMLTEEMRELLNQITAFKNKISKDSKLFFEYAREFNDAQELGNTVETALRARTQ